MVAEMIMYTPSSAIIVQQLLGSAIAQRCAVHCAYHHPHMQIQVLFECFQKVLLGRDGEIDPFHFPNISA